MLDCIARYPFVLSDDELNMVRNACYIVDLDGTKHYGVSLTVISSDAWHKWKIEGQPSIAGVDTTHLVGPGVYYLSGSNYIDGNLVWKKVAVVFTDDDFRTENEISSLMRVSNVVFIRFPRDGGINKVIQLYFEGTLAGLYTSLVYGDTNIPVCNKFYNKVKLSWRENHTTRDLIIADATTEFIADYIEPTPEVLLGLFGIKSKSENVTNTHGTELLSTVFERLHIKADNVILKGFVAARLWLGANKFAFSDTTCDGAKQDVEHVLRESIPDDVWNESITKVSKLTITELGDYVRSNIGDVDAFSKIVFDNDLSNGIMYTVYRYKCNKARQQWCKDNFSAEINLLKLSDEYVWSTFKAKYYSSHSITGDAQEHILREAFDVYYRPENDVLGDVDLGIYNFLRGNGDNTPINESKAIKMVLDKLSPVTRDWANRHPDVLIAIVRDIFDGYQRWKNPEWNIHKFYWNHDIY